MRVSIVLGTFIATGLLWGGAAPRAAGCDPVGNARFICGLKGVEDLVLVPHTKWVIASGLTAPGHVYLIDGRDRSWTVVFPTAPRRQRLDAATYGSCPGPVGADDEQQLRTHGLDLRSRADGVHTLYVLAHGKRESVEVFEVDARPKTPTLTWVGCVMLHEKIGSNSVASLPDGGLVVTNWQTRGDVNWRAKLVAGQNTGEVWEWHPTRGWNVVPNTEMPGPNGIAASSDGKWLYIAGWANQTLMRVSRGQTPPKKDVISTEFHIDNLRWTDDGSLFATGQYGTAEAVLRSGWQTDVSTAVARIDPKTLKVSRPLVRYPSNSVFRFGTGTVQVGRELWVGDATGDRIARFPAP